MSATMLLNEIPVRIPIEKPGSVTGRPADEPSDDEIIARVLNEDVDAFEILMRRYNRYVFAIVSKRVPHAQTPDIVQDVFIQAYKSLPRHCPNTSFKGCLARIAVRCCCDYLCAFNRHPIYAVSNLSAEDREQMERTCEASACDAAQSEMEMERMRETLGRTMNRLEPDDQTILRLIYGENYSPEETAEIMGYSPGNIRVRASRACNVLRKLMDSPVNMASPASGHFLLESITAPA